MFEVKDLRVWFRLRRCVKRVKDHIKAVTDVSFCCGQDTVLAWWERVVRASRQRGWQFSSWWKVPVRSHIGRKHLGIQSKQMLPIRSKMQVVFKTLFQPEPKNVSVQIIGEGLKFIKINT